MKRHSDAARSAYQELLQSHIEEGGSGFRGTPTKVVRKKRVYWYDTYRVGSAVRKRYVGEDNAQLQDQLSHHEDLKKHEKKRSDNRMRLVRILRAEGFYRHDAGAGSLLLALSRAGIFSRGLTLIGTHSFRLYENLLGVRYDVKNGAQRVEEDLARHDLLSCAIENPVSDDFQNALSEFEFKRRRSDADTSVYFWTQSKREPSVSFYIQDNGSNGTDASLDSLNVIVQPCPYLDYLVEDTVLAVVLYRSGVLVRVPKPARFALYSLVTSEVHCDVAETLIRILIEIRPDELKADFEEALARSPIWWASLTAKLKENPGIADLLYGL